MTGVAKNTVTKLLKDMGTVCSIHHGPASCATYRASGSSATRFGRSSTPSRRTSRPRHAAEAGDVWTHIAIDSDTKLVPSFLIGPRDVNTAVAFMNDLRKRLRHRVQLTTDGHFAYLNAVKDAFGDDVDYAMLIKPIRQRVRPSQARAPLLPRASASVPTAFLSNGEPDPAKISTSHIERLNLTMRMSMRRYTRLTNAFSKKVENLAAAVSLHFMHYNFCRKHQTLGITPAMTAGIADHVWTLDELVGLLEAAEKVPVKRGSYKKRAAISE